MKRAGRAFAALFVVIALAVGLADVAAADHDNRETTCQVADDPTCVADQGQTVLTPRYQYNFSLFRLLLLVPLIGIAGAVYFGLSAYGGRQARNNTS